MKLVNKNDIAKALATDLQKDGKKFLQKDAVEIVEKLIDIISDNLVKNGDCIKLGRLGLLKVIEKNERKGRNPSTGKIMTIPSSLSIKFKCGVQHKTRINS